MELYVGLLLSLALIASFRYNRRRTEDRLHPLWSLILARLCGNHLGRLLPTPQFRLYFFSATNSAADPDSTMPGADFEVIPDFCLLLQRVAFASSYISLTMIQFLAQLSPINLPYHRIRVSTLFIPLILELKRSVTRTYVDQSLRFDPQTGV